MIGRTIGSYRVEEKIGAGGVGEVFRAVDLALGRNVAVKVLRPELAEREQLVARFRSEAKTLARLNHPNIALLFAFLEEDGLFMVMEYVEGRTLSSVIRSAGKLQPPSALELFRQTLDGLGYAHELGVIHRDIKGSNVMVDPDFRIKIMDFGIARVVGSEHVTRVGNLVGTPEYMAPEQIRGSDATTRSDIYSAGIVLYHMLTGRVPFRAKGDFETMRKQVDDPPPPLREFVPDLPLGLEDVVLRALAKKPEDRFDTTAAFAEALANAEATASRDRYWNVTRRIPPPTNFGPDVDVDAPTDIQDTSPPAIEATQEIQGFLTETTSRARNAFGAATQSKSAQIAWVSGFGLVGLLLVAIATNRIASEDVTPTGPSIVEEIPQVDPYTWTADAEEVTVRPLDPAEAVRLGLAPPHAEPVKPKAQAKRRQPAKRKVPQKTADKPKGWNVRR